MVLATGSVLDALLSGVGLISGSDHVLRRWVRWMRSSVSQVPVGKEALVYKRKALHMDEAETP